MKHNSANQRNELEKCNSVDVSNEVWGQKEPNRKEYVLTLTPLVEHPRKCKRISKEHSSGPLQGGCAVVELCLPPHANVEALILSVLVPGNGTLGGN